MNHASAVRSLSAGFVGAGIYALVERGATIAKTIENWERRHRTRRDLAAAPDRILRDIGITEADRFIEINKHFWEK
jgi:uncharacterized protein YjiS (DUF1127 family)